MAIIDFIENRSTFDATGDCDSINWSTIGKEGSVLRAGDKTGGSTKGLGYSLKSPSRCIRVDQGRNTQWPGNFNPGDVLLYTLKKTGPVTIVFEQAVRGVGTQIQQRYGIGKIGTVGKKNGAPFAGIIKALDINGSPIVPIATPHFGERNGWSDDSGEGSAIFLGVLCDKAIIKSVEFNTKHLDPEDLDRDFSINTVLLVP